MQIKISKDIAACFDELSILEVKNKFRNIDNNDDSNYIQLWNEIASGITIRKLVKIVKSPEYKELLRLNKKIFKLIDYLRAWKQGTPIIYEIGAKYGVLIDDNNSKRYLAKKALQKKFFDTDVKEIKL